MAGKGWGLGGGIPPRLLLGSGEFFKGLPEPPFDLLPGRPVGLSATLATCSYISRSILMVCRASKPLPLVSYGYYVNLPA